MPTCPQCSKPLRELVRRCPTCQADLDLLVDYVSHLSGGLQRAENLTKAGELGEAVWAYLEVLETDPDNVPARKQVGRVVTAVRKFDLSTPARRIAIGLPPNESRGIWKYRPNNQTLLGGAVIFLVGMLIGVIVGHGMPPSPPLGPKDGDPAQSAGPEPRPNDQIGPVK